MARSKLLKTLALKNFKGPLQTIDLGFAMFLSLSVALPLVRALKHRKSLCLISSFLRPCHRCHVVFPPAILICTCISVPSGFKTGAIHLRLQLSNFQPQDVSISADGVFVVTSRSSILAMRSSRAIIHVTLYFLPVVLNCALRLHLHLSNFQLPDVSISVDGVFSVSSISSMLAMTPPQCRVIFLFADHL